ncbi:rhodanese-like domain-containing protein [Niabella drilacis]|uniref:Rhodanese-like domain-containing protein n=1 Tax=Niabella drilacis (strain DSM 25811 / CCM 8410 / CCUG 62505 / LMG 26954 / E90) TaxID=1285928 RepID=A0A1G6Z5K9_NIADE|nr:rhodanese-like domain-containing protein [Niabella drilacis]SDD97247.1 Rhodanese-like domain-containing protein [Niabella drilacis]
MKPGILLLILPALLAIQTVSAQKAPAKAKVDYDAFEQLVKEVKEHRKKKLVTLDEFLKLSGEKGVVVLDTRSDEMYNRKHIQNAVHLNFSDFTQENLSRMIPTTATKVLIYCNNNFEGDQRNFATKAVVPAAASKKLRPITLALNIPTYINLYGYGYRNVYELAELVNVNDPRLKLEGTEVNAPETVPAGETLMSKK